MGLQNSHILEGSVKLPLAKQLDLFRAMVLKALALGVVSESKGTLVFTLGYCLRAPFRTSNL